MPSDQKRINGPDLSVPYNLHSADQWQGYETRLQSILTEESRRDGRALNEMRKICKYNLKTFYTISRGVG